MPDRYAAAGCRHRQENAVLENNIRNRNVVVILFGAGGDLSWRLIVPALFNLYLDGRFPGRFVLLGVDRQELDDGRLADRYHDGVAQFSRRGAPKAEQWDGFGACIRYQQADVLSDTGMEQLAARLQTLSGEDSDAVEHVFYMATPPSLFAPIARGLGRVGLAMPRKRARIVVEKPLGQDLDSFLEINAALCELFEERQIYRIDHFLGKETVQNILAMRFANPIFEPIWNRRYIDHVSITVAETLGVEHRAGYYEHAGALRDMVQNHLFQLLCLVAMEPPVAYDADDIRGKKLDVLRALRPIQPDEVQDYAARGQYGGGWIDGVRVPAYRDEPDVDPHSNTDTYVGLKLYVDNWRWQDVPFYLRTGKRLPAKVSEASIQFRPVPHQSFPASAIGDWAPNRLVIQIQPYEGILLRFQAKRPGPDMRLSPVAMRFSYHEAFHSSPPEAYETLLLDVMRRDATLFMRADQVEAAWSVVMPVLEGWSAVTPEVFPNYPAGSWGPESAQVLIAKDGHSWLLPSCFENQDYECTDP
jgi:glucose-6-phosphate 1-dehydrogenase